MQPLYIQAKNNALGPLEIMDQETLDWIVKTSESVVGDSITFRPSITSQELEILKQAATQESWFYSPKHIGSIHGMSHNLRVMVFSLLICEQLGISESRPYTVAASLHDVRRMNDNADPEHGDRAAAWFKSHLQEVSLSDELTDSDKELIVQAVQYHQVDYADIPDDVYEKHSTAIDILKAADALDRYRMPKEKWWPQTEYIKLHEAHSLLPVARKITIESERRILAGVIPQEAVFSVVNDYLMKTQ
jgi:hypothetical protein